MDEKGFLISLLQKVQRVFTKEAFKKGKLIGAGQDGNREWITVLATICMDGTFLPPAIIYQAVSSNIQDTWLDDFNPDGQSASLHPLHQAGLMIFSVSHGFRLSSIPTQSGRQEMEETGGFFLLMGMEVT